MSWFIHEGRPLHYLERGRGEPLLLIHGLGSSGADWAWQVAALERRFRVIVPDLPGSGHSAPPGGACSIDGFARSLWALCDHLDAGTAINIVGFSLGGAVSLEMALQRPANVRRLGLINSLATYQLDHWSKWLEAVLTLVLIPLLGMRRAAGLAAKRLFPMPWQRMLRERAAAVVSAVPWNNYLLTGRALVSWTGVGRLHLVKSKTLVIAAENDFMPLAEKRALAAQLGAEFIIVRGSRHCTPFDAVGATNAALSAFIEDRPLPPAERWMCDRRARALRFPGSLAEEHAASAPRAVTAGSAPAPSREVPAALARST
ncbi:MAG TPA: alpha/beta hydrolase [Steroidobacteraceae bacterium]|nr:alpha/beta hydrolase [Steroidobacteraceae bacterium]